MSSSCNCPINHGKSVCIFFFSHTPVVTSRYHGIKIPDPGCLNVGQRYPPEKYNRCQEAKCYENQLRYPLDSNSSSGFRTTGAWMTNFMDLILFHLINFLSWTFAKFLGLNPKGPYLLKLRKIKVLYCVHAAAVVPRELKQRRRRRQRERQKSNRFRLTNWQ